MPNDLRERDASVGVSDARRVFEHDDEIARLFTSRTEIDRAGDILHLLGSADRPLTHREISAELALRPASTSACLALLEKDGYVVSSRRFAVTLGVRFLPDPVLSQVFRGTTMALAKPHLDALAYRFGGTASLAFGTLTSCKIADASGSANADEMSAWSCAVLSRAIHGGDPTPDAPGLALGGVWAGDAGEDVTVMASRVRLRTNIVAGLGLALRNLSLTEFAETSQAIARAAGHLSSSLRRVYPLVAPPGRRRE